MWCGWEVYKMFKKIKEFFIRKSDDEIELDISIKIKSEGPKKAFLEVVNMFCLELEERLGVKLNPDDFINTPGVFRMSITDELSDDEKVYFDLVKKDVQYKIKGVKKYEDVKIIGTISLPLEIEDIKNIQSIISNNPYLSQLKGNAPIYLNMQMVFYTAIFDTKRYVQFMKDVDNYLEYPLLRKDVYLDAKKRINKAIDNIFKGRKKETSNKTLQKMSSKKWNESMVEISKLGLTKLIQLRHFVWIDYMFEKKPELLDMILNLESEMYEKLNSEGPHKDFIHLKFILSNDVEELFSNGYFAYMNDKPCLDESIFNLDFQNID